MFPGILLSSGPDCIKAGLVSEDEKNIGKDGQRKKFKKIKLKSKKAKQN